MTLKFHQWKKHLMYPFNGIEKMILINKKDGWEIWLIVSIKNVNLNIKEMTNDA